MKRMLLLFSILAFSLAFWTSPATSNQATLTELEQQAVVRIIVNFLLSNSPFSKGNTPGTPPPDDGSTTPPVISGNELISTVDGIVISVAGPGGTQILVRTVSGDLLFNLTKINEAGDPLKADSAQWSCLRENSTGLIWELKTNNGSLHDQKDSFTWDPPGPAGNVRRSGFTADSGATCSGYVAGDSTTYCTTQSFLTRVNSQGLCGAQDWRIPTITELNKIISLNRAAPAMYATLFPRGTGKAIWSGSPVPKYPQFAWHIYVNDGYAHGAEQSGNLPVLLVRTAHP